MKMFLYLILSLALAVPVATAAPIGKTPFEKVIYISSAINSTNSAANSGVDYSNAKGFWDGDIWSIPEKTVIEDMYVIVDTVVVGVTLFELGDDDDANDFIASATSPLGTAGVMYDTMTSRGNYLKLGSENFRKYKYYSASGKELKLNVTGEASAGRIRVVVKGYHLGE